jgi:hypothetical protein
MDPRLKTALAVVVGVVIGMTLLGTAFAIPAVLHAVGPRAAMTEQGFRAMGQSPGMMGQGQPYGSGQRPGMMGRPGMRGQGPVGPQDGTGTCPNGFTPESCPGGCTEAPEAPPIDES